MTFAVTLVDAEHRPTVFAEIELDGELVAEAFADGGRTQVAFVGPKGEVLWAAPADDVQDALMRARDALADAALLE